MAAVPITQDVYWTGVNDLETDLFEAIWPLPRGISYNAYLIVDEKTALIETVKKGFVTELLQKIRSVLPPEKTIDYLVINHMEPDHSGGIEILRQIYPDITIVGNRQTLDFLNCFFGITGNVLEISNERTLRLGNHTLAFRTTPMVHWPETMMTFDTTDRILFSGDVFGGFGALHGALFDNEVDLSYYEDEVLRYFSNIIGKYSLMAQKALNTVRDLPFSIIAPTHGPVFRNNPGHIVELYERWSRQETRKGVVCVYASMYGNTMKMMEEVAFGLADNGITDIRFFNISHTHISFIIRDIWKFRALVLGSCTYNTHLFPLMEQLVSFLENDKLQGRLLGILGSYSWSGGAFKRLHQFAQNNGWKLVLPSVEVRCAPSADELAQCRGLGRNVAAALNQ